MGATSESFFVLRLPSGNSTVGLLRFWGPITLHADLELQWGLKQSRSPHQELSNNVSHAACMQGNRVDSWLLVIGSQIVNLTPGFSFGHNLCFRCWNEWCEPILDIYISIAFQWYNDLFKLMGFNPCNCVLAIQESIWDSNFHNGSCLGSVRVCSLTLFALPRVCDVTRGSPLLACNLTTPCLGRKRKARVMT
jgi:hypothetical protein